MSIALARSSDLAAQAPTITGLAGILSARPAAAPGNAGFRYLATDKDGGTEYRSNGTSWVQAAGPVATQTLRHRIEAAHMVPAGGSPSLTFTDSLWPVISMPTPSNQRAAMSFEWPADWTSAEVYLTHVNLGAGSGTVTLTNEYASRQAGEDLAVSPYINDSDVITAGAEGIMTSTLLRTLATTDTDGPTAGDELGVRLTRLGSDATLSNAWGIRALTFVKAS